MKITALSAQVHRPDRVNVSIDGKYQFSLDISQVMELGVRVGREVDAEELAALETESQYGKLYARALEYCLMRPHSVREVRDYLWRKTRTTKKLVPVARSRARSPVGEVNSSERKLVEFPGYSPTLAERVLSKLQHKGYVDDEKFACWWVETRNQTKGTSLRKLRAELQAKGVAAHIIDEVVTASERSDENELAKIIAKKRNKYPDDQKFVQYLARQGFSYADITAALQDEMLG